MLLLSQLIVFRSLTETLSIKEML